MGLTHAKAFYYLCIIVSLTEEDYEKTEWEEIANVRKKNSWESPKTQVVKYFCNLFSPFCMYVTV